MLPRHLCAVVLALLLQSGVEALDQSVPAFLSNTFSKNTREKTQDVLEHVPVTVPSCEQFVRLPSLCTFFAERADQARDICSPPDLLRRRPATLSQ